MASLPMLPMLVIDADDPTPPYEQLRRQLADLITSRTLAGGDRLPPLRQLAGDLALAVGTVARAYRELEAAGLIRSRRGGGTRVVDAPPVLSPAEREHLLRDQAAGFVRQTRLLAASPDEILDAVRAALVSESASSSAPDPPPDTPSGPGSGDGPRR